MITRSELAIVYRRLESELEEADFVLSDVQFDEFEQTLCIVVDDGPKRQLFSSPRTDSRDGATIKALVLWDLLRDLIKLGMNPAIRMRRNREDQGQTHESRGSDDSGLS
jgi:hypothetical protein